MNTRTSPHPLLNRLSTVLLAAAALLGAHATGTAADAPAPLGVGDHLPPGILKTMDGEDFDLAAAIARRPTVLIVYRGGWCPYCSSHLSALVDIDEALADAGVQLLAVSPDQPSKLAETAAGIEDFHYTLLSDQDLAFLEKLGIVFTVPAAKVALYKRIHGIDLEAASGRSHHKLPHPAVYIVDTDGIIRFAHVDPDYKKRLDPSVILETARRIVRP